MNHTERCRLLLDTFKELGYGPIDNGQRAFFSGKSRDPDDCDQGYIFCPERGPAHNYQMFRGYVHDTRDIVYLRINIPGLLHGLGKTPLELDVCNPDFSAQVASFCKTITVSSAAIEQLMHEHCLRNGGTKKQETVPCGLCNNVLGPIIGYDEEGVPFRGDALYRHHGGDCPLCKGKGTRIQVTEQYYL